MTLAKYQQTSQGPRYLWLHDCLLTDIREGKYPVGGHFPTEEKIAHQYQVSRHTVREATRLLVENGLIRRRRSTGTIVTAKEPSIEKPYVAALGSMKELMDYTHNTRLVVFDKENVTLKKIHAASLGVEPQSTWLMLHAYRHQLQRKEPISYSQVFLRPAYADIADKLKGNHASIFNLHADLFGIPVDTVIQRIEAATIPAAAALELGVSAKAPTLKMTRIYLDESKNVMSASHNFYSPDRFELETQWHRSHPDEL